MADHRGAAASLRFLARVAAVAAFAPLAVWWLRLLGLIPDATPVAAIEYLPPSWLLPLVVPAVALLVVARYATTAGVLVFAWLTIALIRGDHALGARSAPPAAGGVDVGLLEWTLAGDDADAIRARLGELRPDVAVLSGGEPALLAALAERLDGWRVLDGGPAGAAIATPHRVLAWRSVDLPPEAEGKRLLHAQVELAGTRVHVLAVDFAERAPLPFTERLRQGGLRLAARDAGSRFLAEFVHGLKGPVIVAGELDVPPSTTAVRRLAGIADDLLLFDHPVGLASLGSWRTPIRTDYLFVRDLAPVRSERIEQLPAGGASLFGVARLPVDSKGSARPASAAVPVEG